MISSRAPSRQAHPAGLAAWIGLFLFAILTSWSGTAAAALKLVSPVHRTHTHPGAEYTVSKTDCLANDDIFIFSLALDAADIGLVLQVWASEVSTCATNADRNTVLAKCRQILDAGTVNKSPVIVTLRGSDIANALENVDFCEDVSGETGPRTIAVAFLLLQSTIEDVPQSRSAIFTGEVDLVPPDPPAQISVVAADHAIEVSVDDIPPPDVAGHYLYCDPPPGDGATDDCQSLAPNACVSCALEPGKPAPGPEHMCGWIVGAATSGVAANLTPGKVHAVAVTAMDAAENESALSPVECAVPAGITTVSQQSFSGGCGLVPVTPTSRLGVAWTALLGALASWLRRRRGPALGATGGRPPVGQRTSSGHDCPGIPGLLRLACSTPARMVRASCPRSR